MSKFNLNEEHELIPRQQNYVLDRKLLTIHSEDRDIKKWPNSNEFEIQVPEALVNVQSIRLVEIGLPANYYVFTSEYQNTKFSFTVDASMGDAGGDAREINSDPEFLGADLSLNPMTTSVQEGFYTPQQMAKEIESKLNLAVVEQAWGGYEYYGSYWEDLSYNYFQTHYDHVGQKIWIGNTYDDFKLWFNKQESYNKCKQPDVWEQYTKWGLPSYLGFDKELYEAVETDYVAFDYDPSYAVPTPWLVADISNLSDKVFYSEPPNTICIQGENAIYMEMDKYNSMDELVPYSEATSNMYNNDYNGTINAAFAKIPVTQTPHDRFFDSRNAFLQNMSHYHPPIDKIRKLKFKFRYHDGRLVDFRKCNFNFTLSFYMLRDEIAREYNQRIPGTYTL